MTPSGNMFLSYSWAKPTTKAREVWALYVMGMAGGGFGLFCLMMTWWTDNRLFGPAVWVYQMYQYSPLMFFITIVSIGLISFYIKQNLLHPRVLAKLVVVLVLCFVSLPAYYSNYDDYQCHPYRHCTSGMNILASYGKGLAQSSIVYAEDTGGRFPPHPSILILRGDIEPRLLIDDVLKPALIPAGIAPADWEKIAAEVDRHSIWNYCGADLMLPLRGLDDRIILAYTKPVARAPEMRDIAFADNHVETESVERMAGRFEESNAARKKLGLPPFYFDGPVPAAPR